MCLSQLARGARTLQKGESVYRAGMRFRGIFALKSGSAKLVHSDAKGREAIVAILLPGELGGLDGLSRGNYRCSLVTLETSCSYDLPEDVLGELSSRLPVLNQRIVRHASDKIEHSIERLAQVSHPADERLARFLLDLGARFHARGYAAEEFNLPLTRQEIGSYLGLTLETVCRLLTRLETLGLIDVDGKFVRLRSLSGLRALAKIPEPTRSR